MGSSLMGANILLPRRPGKRSSLRGGVTGGEEQIEAAGPLIGPRDGTFVLGRDNEAGFVILPSLGVSWTGWR